MRAILVDASSGARAARSEAMAELTASQSLEAVPQPLVLEVVPDEGHSGGRRSNLIHREAVVVGAGETRMPGPGSDNRDVVAARPQRARQLVRAPAAAAAVGGKRISDEEE